MQLDQLLKASLTRGIIDQNQYQAMLDLQVSQLTDVATNLDDYAASDETPDEALRLVGGGNDLFVTIGLMLLLAGAFFVLFALPALSPTLVYAIIGVLVWMIAEIVTRQKRMRLSSTILAVLFVICIAELVGTGLSSQLDWQAIAQNPLMIATKRSELGMMSFVAAGALIAASGIYFWRFGVPILAAIVALTITALGFVQLILFLYDGVTAGDVMVPTMAQLPELLRDALYLPLIAGLIIFGIAVALDIHDRERRTLWSDCAFWLHVVSAPLLVHPLFIMATGQDVIFGEIEPGNDAMVMLGLLIALFFYVALAIDRRSLLVPTLAYFGSVGVFFLINDTANQVGLPPFALILLVVGCVIILFGAGWQMIRRVVVRNTLPARLVARLPIIQDKAVAA